MTADEMSRDPAVRSAVLASTAETEARWLAQNSVVTLRYCTDELLGTLMAERPSAVAAWREAEGITPPADDASWRLPASSAPRGTVSG